MITYAFAEPPAQIAAVYVMANKNVWSFLKTGFWIHGAILGCLLSQGKVNTGKVREF